MPTERLRSVLDHLVQNAFDAAGAEGRVALRARAVGNSAIIEVEDNGPGMDVEFVRHKLFRPFFSTRVRLVSELVPIRFANMSDQWADISRYVQHRVRARPCRCILPLTGNEQEGVSVIPQETIVS